MTLFYDLTFNPGPYIKRTGPQGRRNVTRARVSLVLEIIKFVSKTDDLDKYRAFFSFRNDFNSLSCLHFSSDFVDRYINLFTLLCAIE